MYSKANNFLNKSPLWILEKLSSYWVDKLLMHPPNDGDARCLEVEWLLDTLAHGLHTPEVGINAHIGNARSDKHLGYGGISPMPCFREASVLLGIGNDSKALH